MNRRTLLKAGGGIAIGTQLGRAAALAAPAVLSPHVLFIAAHPDDEILGMVADLILHASATPALDVHVLWLTNGEATGVRDNLNGVGEPAFWNGRHHIPTGEGYATITPAIIAKARVSESETAVRAATAGLPGKVTLHHADPVLADGYSKAASVTFTQATALAQSAILRVANSITTGAVRLKGHSWIIDNDTDHLACGQAIKNLSALYPTRFADRTHYSRPMYWNDPRKSKVTAAWALCSTADQQARARNAIHAFNAWAPTLGAYAIGQQSVPADFNALQATPKSLYHHT